MSIRTTSLKGGFPSKLRGCIAQRTGEGSRGRDLGIITTREYEIKELVYVICTHECCV